MKLFAILVFAAFATGASAQDNDGTDLLTPSPTVVGAGVPALGFAGATSSGPTAETCPEESAAVEACMEDDVDLSNLMSSMQCALCGITALGDDWMNINEDEYCSKWTPCVIENCPEGCQEPMHLLQVCESGFDCGVGSAGTIVLPLAVSSLAVALTLAMM